ncbi:hypothetical protein N7532_003788 [Penicillium argentinense]|uniref:Uncharacterized protein n=1 Tax=Penicillium argentinense TaxID=1131581 RepID=A0A9W9KEB4_9EURO|nr:uncharacterized protein N7532_003788 [Penicillium argentinense]KAJ5103259.1 hypothetical protein N7532_003788 [Penicillium argentinense]
MGSFSNFRIAQPKMADSTNPPHPEMGWDCAPRQILCCLMRFFIVPPGELKLIIGEFVREYTCGAHGLLTMSYETLHAQWLKIQDQDEPVWRHVHALTGLKTDGIWVERISQIQAIAQRLSITLNVRVGNITEPSGSSAFDADEHLPEILESAVAARSETKPHTAPLVPMDPLPMQKSIEGKPEMTILRLN